MVKGLISGAVMLAALAVGGCSVRFAPETDPAAPSSWRRVDISAYPVAFSSTKPMSILAVTERRIGRTMHVYRVVLENPTVLPGENYLLLEVRERPGSLWEAFATTGDPTFHTAYTDVELATRLAEEFPGIEMTIADTVRRTPYGHYAWAEARIEPGLHCVFAWQFLDDAERVLPQRIALMRVTYRICAPAPDALALLHPFEAMLLQIEGALPLDEQENLPLLVRSGPPETRPAAIRPVVPPRNPIALVAPTVISVPAAEPAATSIPSEAAETDLLDLTTPIEAMLIQARLGQLGFYDGPIDGIWGTRSRAALDAFIRDAGIEGDGQWSAALQSRLFGELGAAASRP